MAGIINRLRNKIMGEDNEKYIRAKKGVYLSEEEYLDSLYDTDITTSYADCTKDRPLFPHAASPKVEFKSIPTVLLTRKSFGMISLLVDKCDKEVGWLGLVEEKNGHFLITRIFVPKQQVSGAETDMDSADIARIGLNLIREKGNELALKLRFWGHSHVHMLTSPSSTDDETLSGFIEAGCEYMLVCIANKMGHMRFSIKYRHGLVIDDVPWHVEARIPNGMTKTVMKQIRKNVTEKTYSYPTSYSYPSYKPYKPYTPYDWEKDKKDKKTSVSVPALRDDHRDDYGGGRMGGGRSEFPPSLIDEIPSPP